MPVPVADIAPVPEAHIRLLFETLLPWAGGAPSPDGPLMMAPESPPGSSLLDSTLALRAEIDRINNLIYANVNNGVYRCGFARTQEAYEAAYDALFATLDELEARLGRQRYLIGRQITEADWRLLPTLVRFDVAYFSPFKCNKPRIADYPNLLNYMRELYQVPGDAATVKPRYYVINYWSRVNPTGIIPKGTPVDFGQSHDRARLAA
jgi:glutathionyl-hydroquinone reductase